MSDLQCVILAGGLGTRMRPHTEAVPKAMLPVAGAPFVGHQLALLASQGVRRIVFCVGHRGDLLRAHVGDGSRWGLDIGYVDEGDALRGTAGALRLALDHGALEDEFLVTYGDSYLPIELSAFLTSFRTTDADVLMAVLENADRWDASNVRFEGERLRYDKRPMEPVAMTHIDYGLLAVRRGVVEALPAGAVVDLSDVLRDLSAQGRVAGHEVHERFFEVGSFEGLRDLEVHLSDREGGA